MKLGQEVRVGKVMKQPDRCAPACFENSEQYDRRRPTVLCDLTTSSYKAGNTIQPGSQFPGTENTYFQTIFTFGEGSSKIASGIERLTSKMH